MRGGGLNSRYIAGMSEDTERLLDATTALLPPLLGALEALEYAGRHLHPLNIAALAGDVDGYRQPLADGLAVFKSVSWPDRLGRFASYCDGAAGHTMQALDGLSGAASLDNPAMGAYRALGRLARATEALYPVSTMLPAVSRYFVHREHRDDEALAARLADADPSREEVGIVHSGNLADQRGGFSIYVPEYYRGEPCPLIVALHGGSGHGRSFLWTWLRDARTRGVILVSPTSRAATWSLMGRDIDSGNLDAIIDHVKSHWRIDERRVLLTGMSDGGTFCYLSGLRDDAPFTHLAPCSASFHPMLLEVASPERLRGLPVYLMHGALDWMFPIEVARGARDALTIAGANLTYREIDDLSHTYPREENNRIIDWLTG